MAHRAGGLGECKQCGHNKRLIERNGRIVVRGHQREIGGKWVTCPGSNQPPR